MLNRPYSPLLLCASLVLPLLSMLGLQSAARAQGFPTKPVKVILPSPPGGGTDALARILADKLRDKWSQPVIVENRAGAGGNIAGDVTSKAVPDGYTLMLAHPAPLVINKALYSKLSYDPDQFVPVSLVATVPNVLVVNARSPAASVAQLIAMARAEPGKLNFASGAVGSPSSLTPELFKSMTGVNIPSIPFQGSAPALVALLGGQVDMLFVELSTALPHIRAGKLRALAVAAERRSPFLPEVPTLADMLPGFNASVWFGIVAPPKTPAALAEQISRAVADALKLADVSKQLVDMSMEAVGGTPAEMAQYLREESRRWGAVIRQSGARAD